MSIHRSLKSKGKLKRHRNVLNRTERLEQLQEDDRWDEEQSVFGIPKVKVEKARRRVKDKKETEEGVEGAEGAVEGEGAPEAIPAADETRES